MKLAMQIVAIVLLCLVFGSVGVAKMARPEHFLLQFAQLRLPREAIPMVGMYELVAVAILGMGRGTIRRFGAAMLAVAMAVAAGLHIIFETPAAAVPAMALMLLASWIAVVPLCGSKRRGASYA